MIKTMCETISRRQYLQFHTLEVPSTIKSNDVVSVSVQSQLSVYKGNRRDSLLILESVIIITGVSH